MTIREMRKAAGLTVEQMLDGCPIKGIDPPLVSKIERGLANPTDAFLRYVAARCGQELPKTKTPRLQVLASSLKRIMGRKDKLNGSD